MANQMAIKVGGKPVGTLQYIGSSLRNCDWSASVDDAGQKRVYKHVFLFHPFSAWHKILTESAPVIFNALADFKKFGYSSCEFLYGNGFVTCLLVCETHEELHDQLGYIRGQARQLEAFLTFIG